MNLPEPILIIQRTSTARPADRDVLRAAEMAGAHSVRLTWRACAPDRVALVGQEFALKTVIEILRRSGFLQWPELMEA